VHAPNVRAGGYDANTKLNDRKCHIAVDTPARRLGAKRCRPRSVQVVELTPRVRSARRFADRAVVEQGIEPRIRVGL